jgi:hypothetical protein
MSSRVLCSLYSSEMYDKMNAMLILSRPCVMNKTPIITKKVRANPRSLELRLATYPIESRVDSCRKVRLANFSSTKKGLSFENILYAMPPKK